MTTMSRVSDTVWRCGFTHDAIDLDKISFQCRAPDPFLLTAGGDQLLGFGRIDAVYDEGEAKLLDDKGEVIK